MMKLFRIMLWLAGIFAMLLLVAIGILCYLAYEALDEKPLDVPVKIPDMNASASVYKKLDLAGTLMSAFKKHKKDEPAGKTKTVELNEKEVNAMLISALIFADQALSGKGGEKELRDASFAGGAFTVLVSKNINFKMPFGSALPIGNISFHLRVYSAPSLLWLSDRHTARRRRCGPSFLEVNFPERPSHPN